MLRRAAVPIVLAAIAAFGLFWLLTAPVRIEAASLPVQDGNAENGRAVFFAGGCPSCHMSEGETDNRMLGGGQALKSPFGTFYAPNISPDREQGIGAWTASDFVTALVNGVSRHDAHLYPAFPYTTYTHIKVEDALDLLAYLNTLPPVATPSRPHDLPFPITIRRTLGIWKLLFLREGPIPEDSSQSAEYNRGSYLVNALGHCAECHSPRNILGGIIEDRRFAGGEDVETGGWVPNITGGSGGIGDWSEEDIVELLASGMTPDFDSVGGSMAKVVRNTSQLSEADRRSIAVYIKALPARASDRPGT